MVNEARRREEALGVHLLEDLSGAVSRGVVNNDDFLVVRSFFDSGQNLLDSWFFVISRDDDR